jgi:transposase
MMRPGDEVEVLLCREPVDFRKAINGLSILVEQELGLDLFSPRIFAFTNRKKDRVKLLYWDRTGFALWLKRLEKARFPWPEEGEAIVSFTGRELNWLLDGIDFFRLEPHESLSYDSVL